MPLARLVDRAVLAVTGPDARPFLHNLLTQNVETLEDGDLRYGALLTPQGRLLHDLFLLGTAEGVLLDVAASAQDDLLRRLTLYKLRAKVTLEPTPRSVWAAWGSPQPALSPLSGGTGGEAARVGPSPDPRTPLLGWRIYATEPPAGADAELDAYDAHRVALGVPDAARDGLSDKAYPLEADLDLLNGVDFKKGCFIGQETTSRMHRRGTLKTRLLPLAVDDARAGAEVLAGTLRAGEVVYARPDRALALLRLDRIQGATLTVDDRRAAVEPPPWFPAVPSPAEAC
jgi:tRNA-modifying protein YgfZ